MKKGHYFAKFAKSFKKGYKSSEKRTEKLFANDLFAKNLTVFVFAFLAGIAAGKSFNIVNHSFAEGISEATPKIEQSVFTEKPSIEKASTKTITTDNKSIVSTATSSHKATNTTPATKNDLYISKIGLNEPVISAPNAVTPDHNVGQYGNLLFGHSTGVFRNLGLLTTGDKISLYGKNYTVYASSVYAVSDDMKKVGDYTTTKLGYGMGESIVLMTCTGHYKTFKNGQYSMSHRILVFANPD